MDFDFMKKYEAHEEKKLIKRIRRQFDKCTYIGDIAINDSEYNILIALLRRAYNLIMARRDRLYDKPEFAVAMVQIGIRRYNGSFWNHVSEEIGEHIPVNQQTILGDNFYYILEKYDKLHVEKNEIVKNILMHAFITEYYSKDLFDFLFAYYEHDLDRDLERNNKEMRDMLMHSMSKGENSVRAYKIKRHTADAVTLNDRGCRIRIARILRFIDNALYNNILPENSKNRIAVLFVDWAKKSKSFDSSKKEICGLGKRGIKRFSTPYLHFTGNNFELRFPMQNIYLNDEEESALIEWLIEYGDESIRFEAECRECVTGLKTERDASINFDSEHIFDRIKISLIKNGTENIHKFDIPERKSRMFDEDGDQIFLVRDNLPEGDAYAFTRPEDKIESDALCGKPEKRLGMNLFTLSLFNGDIVKYPEGYAKSCGKEIEEGILKRNAVSGAYIIDKDKKYNIYSAAPKIIFTTELKQEHGTIIRVNGKVFRLNDLDYTKFSLKAGKNEYGYLIDLKSVCEENSIYNIDIDIPNDRKDRSFEFAYIKDFDFNFEDAPYIFREFATVSFPSIFNITSSHNTVRKGNICDFQINTDRDYEEFILHDSREFLFRLYVPVLKWKADDKDWRITAPEDIWYKEFPKMIYLKFPDDKVTFSMDPVLLNENEDDEENITFSEDFSKNKQNHMFTCDTRKMLSWFGDDEPIRKLYIQFNNEKFIFTKIFVKSQLLSCEIFGDERTNEIIVNCDIMGFSEYVVDVYCNNEKIIDHAPVSSRGLKKKIKLQNGNYRAVFFETDEDGDEFGFQDYTVFGKSRVQKIFNRYDLSGKEIVLNNIVEIQHEHSIFKPRKFSLSEKITITDLERSDDGDCTYIGFISSPDTSVDGLKVFVDFYSESDFDRVHINFYDIEEEGYIEFLYDLYNETIVEKEDESLTRSEAYRRYQYSIFDEDYYYLVSITNRKEEKKNEFFTC